MKPTILQPVVNTTYTATTSPVWIRKEGITGCPARVSGHGSLPSPRDAYELKHRWSVCVTDIRGRETYHNTFYGFTIESQQDAEDMARLMGGDWDFRNSMRDIAAANEGMTILDVFRLWEQYENQCRVFDQTPVIADFEKRNALKSAA